MRSFLIRPRVVAHVEQIVFIRGAEFRIAAHLDLLVVQPNGRKVFREPLVEPTLRRRIVVVQQKMGEMMRDGAIGIVLGDIKYEELTIFARNEKSRGADW